MPRRITEAEMKAEPFGRLQVLREGPPYAKPDGTFMRRWVCLCACGEEFLAAQGSLRDGRTTSCGCLRRDQKKSGTGHPLYHCWQSMKKRCSNPGNQYFSRYGGRGITVCQRWQDSFEAFLEDMGEKPGPEYSLDRIDNDGNYEPGNCRWATWSAQANNKSTNRVIEAEGMSLTVAQWARRQGVSPHLIHTRLYEGWPEVEAVLLPKNSEKPRTSLRST